jgi:hypothetical protein
MSEMALIIGLSLFMGFVVRLRGVSLALVLRRGGEMIEVLVLVVTHTFVGVVSAYAWSLWNREPRRYKHHPYGTGLNDGTKFTHVPLPPPGATQTRIYGGSGTSFKIAHDCRAEGCVDSHGRSRH